MNRTILLCAMLTVSFSVMAEPERWMKKDDPNTLGLFVMASDCPFDIKELRDMAEGEYLRARIKPTYDMSVLTITIKAVCLNSMTGGGRHIGTSAAYTIDFSAMMNFPDYTTVNYTPGAFSILNAGPNKMEAKTSFLTEIREDLNDLITDYLKANFE
jgi:hypothetical protein